MPQGVEGKPVTPHRAKGLYCRGATWSEKQSTTTLQATGKATRPSQEATRYPEGGTNTAEAWLGQDATREQPRGKGGRQSHTPQTAQPRAPVQRGEKQRGHRRANKGTQPSKRRQPPKNTERNQPKQQNKGQPKGRGWTATMRRQSGVELKRGMQYAPTEPLGQWGQRSVIPREHTAWGTILN